MHFIRQVFYWASSGCPDAVPKGIVAVDLEGHFDQKTDLIELGNLLCSIGIFDDTCWQIGCTKEDVDLIVKTEDRPQYGQMGRTLSNDAIIPTWQCDIIKKDERIKISEHTFTEYLDFLNPEDREQFQK